MDDKNEERKEVIIELTDEQRQHIKKATGKLITELKVEIVDDRATPFAFVDGSVH